MTGVRQAQSRWRGRRIDSDLLVPIPGPEGPVQPISFKSSHDLLIINLVVQHLPRVSSPSWGSQGVSGRPPRNRVSFPTITTGHLRHKQPQQAGQDSARVKLAAEVPSRHQPLISQLLCCRTLRLHLHPFLHQLRSTDDLRPFLTRLTYIYFNLYTQNRAKYQSTWLKR